MFFLKMQGERVWDTVEYGWGPSLILDVQGRSTGELKPKHERTKPTLKVVKPMLELYLVFLIEFV